MICVQRIQTEFQAFEIWKSSSAVEFRVKGAIHAWYHSKRFLTGLAWDLIAAAPLLKASGPPRSVLMLGLAGGTSFRILRHLLPDCQLVAVDIDEEMIDLAREHMHLDETGVEVVIADAYTWVKNTKRRFDVVIDDLYLAGKSDVYRPRDWDHQWISTLKNLLTPEGVLAVNLVTGEGHRKMQSQTRRCMLDEFEVVRTIRTPGAMNEVLVAGSQVQTAHLLGGYQSRFVHWRDRDYWGLMRVRRL